MKILNKILSASVALALAASFIACSNEVSGGDSVHTNFSKAAVSGVVTEYVSVDNSNAVVKGLEGARVTMGKYSATTDSNGVWTITGVEPGKYVAYVSKSGYSEAKTSTEITVDAKTYEDLKLASANALKEELLKTIANLGVVNPATGAGLSSAGQLGGTIEGETAVANGTAVATVGQSYTIDKDLLRWFDTNVAAYDYEYAIVADAMVITPLKAGVKGTLKLRSSSIDNVNVTEVTAGKDITLYFYDASVKTLYATAKTNDKGEFTVDSGLPSYVAANTLTVLADPFVVDGQVYGTTAARGVEASPVLIPGKVINAQTFCFTGKNVEDCVIVTETNVGAKTVSAPLALTTPLTFKFDRAVAAISFAAKKGAAAVTTDFAEGKNYTVTFSDDKQTVTLTPIPSKWEADFDTIAISALITTDNYKLDDLVTKEFTVKFDKDFYVTSSTLEDVAVIGSSAAKKPVDVLPTSDIVVEFSKEIAYVSKLTFTGYEEKDVKVDGKKITVTPKANVSGVNKFTAADFTVKVVAKDGSVCEYKVTGISYATFKLLTAEIVDKTAARAVINVGADKALKLTYSQEVKEVKNVQLGGKDAVTEVKGNVVYIDFNDSVNTNTTALSVTGTVVSKLGDEVTLASAVTDTFQSEVTYKIVKSSWTGVGASVNGVNGNDSEVESKVGINDSLVLTFNKDFAEGSVADVELYKSSEVGSKTSKAYATTATVAGKTVTIKPAAALEKGTKYYIAFSVAKDGVTAFTTKRGIEVDAAAGTIKETVGSYQNYIFFETVPATVAVKTGVNTKTTVAPTAGLPVDVASISVEYDYDITGFKVLVTNSALFSTTDYTAAKNDAENGKMIAATTAIDKKVLTVTPAGVLATGEIYISVFDADGKNGVSKKYTVDYSVAKALKAALAKGTTYTAKIADLKLKDATKKVDASDVNLDLTFKSLKKAVTYYAYKAVTKANKTYADYTTTSTAGSKGVDAIDVIRETADVNMPVGKAAGTSAASNDMTYGPIKYVVTATYEGIFYVSNELELSDTAAPDFSTPLPAALTADAGIKLAAFQADSATLTSGITVVSKEVLLNATVVVAKATGSGLNATITLGENSFVVKFTGVAEAKAGDIVTITATDLRGNNTVKTIKIIAD